MAHPTTLDLGKIVGPSAFESWCAIQDPPVDPLVTESWDLFIEALKGPQGIQGVPGADGLTQEQVDARVAAVITGKQDTLTFDNSPTENSTNPVKSGGVFTALAGKMASMTVDTSPTQNSANLVTSGGVKSALDNLGLTDTGWVAMTMGAAVTSGVIRYRVRHGVLYLCGTFTFVNGAAVAVTTSAIPAEYRPSSDYGLNLLIPCQSGIWRVGALQLNLTDGKITSSGVADYQSKTTIGPNISVTLQLSQNSWVI